MKRWTEGVKSNNFQGGFAAKWNRGAFDPKAARDRGPQTVPWQKRAPWGGGGGEASGSAK